MRHAKSNLNLLKNIKKTKSINTFKNKKGISTPISPNIHSRPKSSTKKNKIKLNNNHLLNVFEKSNNNSPFASKLYNNDSYSNLLSKLFTLSKKSNSATKNINNHSGSSIKKNVIHKRGNDNINIRLNLNSEIINNNFLHKGNYHKKYNNNYTTNYKFDIHEKIKEKDKQITLLQRDLLQTQELLNQLQKDKQKEISVAYNSIKKVNNYPPSIFINNSNSNIKCNLNDYFSKNMENKNLKILKTAFGTKGIINKKNNSKIKNNKNQNSKNNKSLSNFLNTPSLLTFDYYKKNSIRNKYKNPYSAISKSTTRKYNFSKQNYGKCFFSKPNEGIYNSYDSFNKMSKNTIRKKNNSKNIRLVYKLNNVSKNEKEKCIVNNVKLDFQSFIKKCEELKQKTKLILNNYIILTQILKIKNIGSNNKTNK